MKSKSPSMSFPLFIARRLFRGEGGGRRASRPAVVIAQTGIAVGLAVMLVAVSVVVGFKSEVRDKIVGFGAHLQVGSLAQMRPYEPVPIGVDTALRRSLAALPGVARVQRFSLRPGLVKTADAFQGMLLKGLGPEYDTCFWHRHLVAGSLPAFSDTAASGRVAVSRALADRLELHVGDRLDTYYIDDAVRVRRLTVAAIYETHFAEYDNLFLLTDLYTVNRLNGWQPDQAGGLELMLSDGVSLEDATWTVGSLLEGRTDRYGEAYAVHNVEQLNPALFAWLGVLDVDIWVILVLMMGVAGFTIISGLLILIIERTPMIGTLKALGADNGAVRRVFLWLSVFLIGRGMLWGNAVGLGLCLLQQATGFATLDAATYYMDKVPVAFNLWYIVGLNVGTLVVAVAMLVGPSCLVSHIRPADSMRYE